jgi:exosortase
LRASFFPFFLFAFCLPLSGGPSEKITFPLRMLATKITSVFSHAGLGINVIQDGTRIFDANGSYQYEVAAACSGIRSLTATLALSIIYGFVMFKAAWKRLFMVAAAFPLAVTANVFRLTTIIIAAEAFGQRAGNFVHENSWLSLLPYIPAIGGILLIGHFLNRGSVSSVALGQPALTAAEQKS